MSASERAPLYNLFLQTQRWSDTRPIRQAWRDGWKCGVMGSGMTAREVILREVSGERDRQEMLWGEQNHIPEIWLRILGEEFGEVCKALNEGDDQLENYREELKQVAAVAVSMIECFDRNEDRDV